MSDDDCMLLYVYDSVDIVLHVTGHQCMVGYIIIFSVKVFMSDLDFSLT
jgi:hypothetical protein